MIVINISRQTVLPNTVNGSVKLDPGKYVAVNHDAHNPSDYKLYRADAAGQMIGEPFATVGITVQDDEVLIS